MNNQPNMPRKGARRAFHAALTVVVIAAVLAVNILFSFVADRFMWQVDETVTRYTTRPGVSMYTNTEEFMAVIRDFAIPMVEEMLAKVPYDAPKFSLDPEVKDFYAFTPDSVKLEGYQAHPVPGKIPVAV